MGQARIETPIGWLGITVDSQDAVVAVSFVGDRSTCGGEDRAAARAARQLEAYFAGELRVFELDLAPQGSQFERRVWSELVRIPYGRTDTYGGIAERLGDPGASRAVGLANARNPIAIVVPCHRVVGADGDLTGYAGGLWRKRWLLAFEGGQRELDLGPATPI